MAKKSTKKKAAPKSGAKGAKGAKSAAKGKGAKKASKALGPFDVKTGKGATAHEIGADVVRLFNERTPDAEIWRKWFSPKLVSIEGSGSGWRTLKGAKKKAEQFHQGTKVNNAKATGPFVGATGFAIHFDVEMQNLESGQTSHMTEVGVYTVKNGRVVQEEFMYDMGT